MALHDHLDQIIVQRMSNSAGFKLIMVATAITAVMAVGGVVLIGALVSWKAAAVVAGVSCGVTIYKAL